MSKAEEAAINDLVRRRFQEIWGEEKVESQGIVSTSPHFLTPDNANFCTTSNRNARIARTQMVVIASLSRAPASRMRARPNQQLIADYARAMIEGAEFPPIVIFEDKDRRLHLADGHHRVEAAAMAVLQDSHRPAEVLAEIRPGTFKDAVRYALRANLLHGKRMTDADYKGAIELAFNLGLVPARLAKDLAPAVVSLTGCSIQIAQRFSSGRRKAILAKRDRLIVRMYREGHTQKAISGELIVARPTVSKVLRGVVRKSYVNTTGKANDPSPKLLAEPLDAQLDGGRSGYGAAPVKRQRLRRDIQKVEATINDAADFTEFEGSCDHPAAVKALNTISEAAREFLAATDSLTALRKLFRSRAAGLALAEIEHASGYLDRLRIHILYRQRTCERSDRSEAAEFGRPQ
jgi:DNA-binding NarL/FixJ family response regulator